MIIDSIVFRGLLSKGEEIRYVAHIHPFTIYAKLFKILGAGLLIPAGGHYLFPPFWPLWAVWAAMGILLFKYRVIQWYMDAWIVTNYAVIDQEWQSFFNKSTTRIEYGNVEGITRETKGFWQTILQYGNVQMEHVSGQPVVLNNVSRPKKLEREIISLQQSFMKKQTVEDHGKLKDLLTSLLRSSAK
jgi:hypothetical protein